MLTHALHSNRFSACVCMSVSLCLWIGILCLHTPFRKGFVIVSATKIPAGASVEREGQFKKNSSYLEPDHIGFQ